MIRLIVLLIGIWIGYKLGNQRPSSASKPLSPAPPSSPVRPARAPDDLTEINGIGPSFAQALNAIDIHTFAQLVTQDPDTLAERLAVRVTADRIRRDGWIEQARIKAGNG